MPKKLLTVLDLANLSADPSTTGFTGGEMYYNTTSRTIRMWDGIAWRSLDIVSFVSQAKWGVD